MRFDQVFGLLVIILAIYLGVTATGQSVDGGFIIPPDLGAAGTGSTTDGNTQADTGSDGSSGDAADGQDAVEAPARRDARVRAGSRRELVITESTFCAAARQRSTYTDLGRANDAAILCMETAGVVVGTSATRFDPADAVTRGQTAEAIAAMIDLANELATENADLRGLPPPDDARFRDVTADTPHRLAIVRLNETPVLQGYVDARYEPHGKVTRAQMASLLDRTYQYVNRAALPIGRDRFDDDETSVHEESINAVAAADIMQGVGDQRFAPRRSVRRGELARYLTLVMIRMEEKNRITPLPAAMAK